MLRITAALTSLALGAAGLVLASAPAHAGKGADPDATLEITVPIDIVQVRRETPIPSGGTSYYCAVGPFVRFADKAGWQPDHVSFTDSNSPKSQTIGPAPYDDAAAIDNIPFTPPPGLHQVLLFGDVSHGQGGTPAVYDDCDRGVGVYNGLLSDTAVVTYVRTELCGAALSQVVAAQDAVKKAKKKAGTTTGKAHQQALADLAAAQKKLAKAKKKAKKACK